MPLKNYTSKQSASRSISYIEQKLAQHGVTHILKEYSGDGRVIGISFIVNLNGRDIPFKLPSNIEACQRILEQNLGPRARPETWAKIPAQAERTAWKILFDWVEAQMAMIELAQVDLLEVFMPYMFDPVKKKTVYKIAAENNFQRLLPATEEML